MKKKNSLLIYVAILLAFAFGFVIGINIEYPRVDDAEVSGTIGKVNNYRNTKATEADIHLKNELLTDSAMLKYVINYMNFFYVRAVEFGKNIDFAVSQANTNEKFKEKNKTVITELENYGQFLSTTRKDLLLAVAACKSIEETDPALLRNRVVRANNIIAQMNYRNNTVVNFITVLDSFIQESGTGTFPELNKAHDLLTFNIIGSSLILKDQVLLKFFENKKLYSKNLKPAGASNLKETINRDMETLGMTDMGKLEEITMDAAKLSETIFFDVEKLGTGFTDAEKLRASFTDAEELGLVWDTEKLQSMFAN
jgi:hypothetical protein